MVAGSGEILGGEAEARCARVMRRRGRDLEYQEIALPVDPVRRSPALHVVIQMIRGADGFSGDHQERRLHERSAAVVEPGYIVFADDQVAPFAPRGCARHVREKNDPRVPQCPVGAYIVLFAVEFPIRVPHPHSGDTVSAQPSGQGVEVAADRQN